jgi:phosphonate transport system substrate-binding protein
MKQALVKLVFLAAAVTTLFSIAVAQAPITVRIGFNPTQNSDLLTAASEGIANYLESQLGGAVEVQVFIPTDYRGLIEAMGSGNLDFAFFPPDGFVVANREVGAMVLLKSVRSGNPYYWSAIVVRKDSGIENIGDLEGKSIAWIDPNSAAGYTFPRAELITAGINPDDFFSNQVYAGGHDAAVLAVLNGSVDAAATFANDDQNISGAWTQFLDADQASQITAIFYTRPIPGDTFSVSQQFASEHAALTYQIAAAIATIKAPDNNLLTDLYRIDYMIPADSSDYAVVRDTRRILGLDL